MLRIVLKVECLVRQRDRVPNVLVEFTSCALDDQKIVYATVRYN